MIGGKNEIDGTYRMRKLKHTAFGKAQETSEFWGISVAILMASGLRLLYHTAVRTWLDIFSLTMRAAGTRTSIDWPSAHMYKVLTQHTTSLLSVWLCLSTKCHGLCWRHYGSYRYLTSDYLCGSWPTKPPRTKSFFMPTPCYHQTWHSIGEGQWTMSEPYCTDIVLPNVEVKAALMFSRRRIWSSCWHVNQSDSGDCRMSRPVRSSQMLDGFNVCSIQCR